jgi:methionyl-tRNA synthetase
LLAKLTVALQPFLPHTAEKIREGLQMEKLDWQGAQGNVLLQAGHSIGSIGILFEKITDEQVALQVAKLQQAKTLSQSVVEPQKENITFEQFQQMDLRMVKILEAEKVAKTKKLLKLKVDTGMDHRTVVSGIAEHYEPEQLIGKSVLMLVNLAPREIKGIESQGMILMAENVHGVLSALNPDKEVQPGNVVA